jgi:hypothetical protein
MTIKKIKNIFLKRLKLYSKKIKHIIIMRFNWLYLYLH